MWSADIIHLYLSDLQMMLYNVFLTRSFYFSDCLASALLNFDSNYGSTALCTLCWGRAFESTTRCLSHGSFDYSSSPICLWMLQMEACKCILVFTVSWDQLFFILHSRALLLKVFHKKSSTFLEFNRACETMHFYCNWLNWLEIRNRLVEISNNLDHYAYIMQFICFINASLPFVSEIPTLLGKFISIRIKLEVESTAGKMQYLCRFIINWLKMFLKHLLMSKYHSSRI